MYCHTTWQVPAAKYDRLKISQQQRWLPYQSLSTVMLPTSLCSSKFTCEIRYRCCVGKSVRKNSNNHSTASLMMRWPTTHPGTSALQFTGRHSWRGLIQHFKALLSTVSSFFEIEYSRDRVWQQIFRSSLGKPNYCFRFHADYYSSTRLVYLRLLVCDF